MVPPGRTDAVVPFYEALGLARVEKPLPGPGAWFDVPGGTQVHVSERPGDRHPAQHFALAVDDLDAVVARVRAAGHPWRDAEPVGGARRGMTADPEGNAVELVEAAGSFAVAAAAPREDGAGVSSAAHVLGRAFTTDPVFRWLLDGRSDLERRTTALFGAFVDAAGRTDGAQVLVGSHGTAASVWRPPGRWRASTADVLRSTPVMLGALGSRIPRALRLLHVVERQHPREPHWYLEAIGVVPEARGQGHGREVLQPVLDRCDEAQLPAYLESSNPRNLSFYARHGFRTMPPLDLPSGCPLITPMWREPVRR